MSLYHSLIDRLRSQHEAIDMILPVADNGRLLRRPQPGKWNIHDNIAHLAKYQPAFQERIKMIITSDHPVFKRYRAEDDPEFETWRSWSTADLVARLKTDRQEIFRLITSLSDSEVSKVGIHAKYGPLTIVQWVEFFLLHEAHHIFTIFQLAHDTEGNTVSNTQA